MELPIGPFLNLAEWEKLLFKSILIGFRSLSHSGQIKKNAKSQSERIYRATNLKMGLKTNLGCVQEGRRPAEKRKREFTKYIFQ